MNSHIESLLHPVMIGHTEHVIVEPSLAKLWGFTASFLLEIILGSLICWRYRKRKTFTHLFLHHIISKRNSIIATIQRRTGYLICSLSKVDIFSGVTTAGNLWCHYLNNYLNTSTANHKLVVGGPTKTLISKKKGTHHKPKD